MVGNWLLPKARAIANQRIRNAKFYDKKFSKISQISIPPRPSNYKLVYHLHIVFAEKRDALLRYCLKKGIEAKYIIQNQCTYKKVRYSSINGEIFR